jgi:hypothetical protein
MSVLYKPTPILNAIDTMLTAVLPATVDGKTLAVELDASIWSAPQVIIEQAGGPDPTAFTFGGHDWAVLGAQLTSVGATRTQARMLGDLVREAMAGQTRLGAPLHPLAPVGATVTSVVSDNDGAITQDNPPTWTETYRIRYASA